MTKTETAGERDGKMGVIDESKSTKNRKNHKADLSKGLSVEQVKSLFPGLPSRMVALLAAYVLSCGQLMKACQASGVHFTTHYLWKKRSKKYLAAFEMAEQVASDFMISEAHRRAFEGTDRPVTWQGKVTDHYREHSDLLTMFSIKARRPEFRDNWIASSNVGPVRIEFNFAGANHTYRSPEKQIAPTEAEVVNDKNGEEK